MALSTQFLDELRARIGLVDVIGRRVKLQRKGREHSGLCPFHNEKTPSFTVNEDKGFFHCFGCGAHGDVIGFVMRSEHLSFPEAIERLAAQAGLAVPQSSPQERARAERAKSLATALEAACAFYERQLAAPAGREARDYVRRRGLEEVTIARFRLGWAPAGNALKAHLLKEGYKEAMLLEAGLLGRNEERNETFDYFRGRVIFPIADARGRVVAFGGRVLGDGTPKYLNSREGELFHKGRMLYGLAQARQIASETGRVVVVEGYMDVVALHQAGFNTAVAPLGTALTEAQLGELWRLVDEPILCFDGDAAGQRAAGRALDRALPLLKPGKSLRFVTLPAGEDPDSFLRRGDGVGAMRQLLDRARPLVELVWELGVAAHPADTPERRAALEKWIEDFSQQIGDAAVRRFYRRNLRDRFWERFGGRGFRPAANIQLSNAALKSPGDLGALDLRIAQGLVVTVINHPSILDEVWERFSIVPLAGRDLEDLRQAILSVWNPDIDSEALKNQLRDRGFDSALRRLLTPELFGAAPFARPDQKAEAAMEGWVTCYERLAQRQFGVEQAQAEERLARDLNAESLAWFDAWRRQRDAEKRRATVAEWLERNSQDSKAG
jgi:DNA primase